MCSQTQVQSQHCAHSVSSCTNGSTWPIPSRWSCSGRASTRAAIVIASSSDKRKVPKECDYVDANILFSSLPIFYLWGIVSVHESTQGKLGFLQSVGTNVQTQKPVTISALLAQDSRPWLHLRITWGVFRKAKVLRDESQP